MFTFALGVYDLLFSEDPYKILIIGLKSSGKTTFVEQLKLSYAQAERSINGRGGKNHTSCENLFKPPTTNAEIIKKKNIRPTFGLNMTRLKHFTTSSRNYENFSNKNKNNKSTCCENVNNEQSTSSTSFSSISFSLVGNSSSLLLTSAAKKYTQLLLWDVGGSMQNLWPMYFNLCHAVIFIVDSTSGISAVNDPKNNTNNCDDKYSDKCVDDNKNKNNNCDGHCGGGDNKNNSSISSLSSCCCVVSSPSQQSKISSFDGNYEGKKFVPYLSSSSFQLVLPSNNKKEEEKKEKKSLKENFEENAAILRELFCNPLLANTPLLILSNKTDIKNHFSLADVQEALGLINMAFINQIYNNNNKSDDNKREDFVYENKKNDDDDDVGNKSLESKLLNNNNNIGIVGSSGIGKKIMRLMEISALNGHGVKEAMDWLVLQLKENKRVV